MEEARAERPSEAGHWLENIGLGRYADLFAQNRIDLDVLPDLTEADLAELGVPLGDRKRLLRAVISLARELSGLATVTREVVPQATTVAERRQLTVMFCDMVGSTELSERFDPEDVRDLIATYRETCNRAVRHFDGFVARYVGDGIMVYFGYPNAHEDDAERAVRAGLEIVRTYFRQPKALSPEPLREADGVRIGIATGLVVVGDVIGEGTQEHDSAVGETPNLAARLHAMAPPNSVVIASTTQRLLGEKFEYEDLGKHLLKGVSAPLQVWRVIQSRRIESRFASFSTNLTPLINREEEIALLLVRWQQAKQSDGQVVLLSGEPGIGKSRILHEFRQRITNEPHSQIWFQCSPYYTSSAFHPFIDHLQSEMDLNPEGSEPLKALEAVPAVTDQAAAVLLTALLSAGTDDRHGPLNLSPQRQKDETMMALVNRFAERARRQPTVIIFEDVHWMDLTSREVLDLLVDRIQYGTALIIITSRPEFQPGWDAHSHITKLTLNRLSRQLRAAMINGVTGTRALPKEVVEEIIIKTDGVPLFVEELTKAVLESNVLCEKDGRYDLSGAPHQFAIPATLTDSLMARLDRMGPLKRIAQIGATIGREFSYQLLCAVAETPEDQLGVGLGHLEDANLIVRRGHPPEAKYIFKHALVQDAAYSSLLHRERKKLHAMIAAVLVEIHHEKVEREPELVAYHLTAAGKNEPAIEFWLKAGRRAAKTGANLEAIGHLGRGIQVLEGAPDMVNRDGVELALRIELGVYLIAAKGYAVQEVEENYARALHLGQRLNDEEKIFAAKRGLWVCYFIRANLAKAGDLSDQLLELAEFHWKDIRYAEFQRTGQLIEAHRSCGMTALYRGCFAASRDHLKRGISIYDPKPHSHLIETHGIEPGIVCRSYLGFSLWFLGCPDQARECSAQAFLDAERIGHPYTLAFASAFCAYLCQHLRDVEGTLNHAQRAIAISSEHGFLHWKHQATLLQGWALVGLGQVENGLKQIRLGLDGYEAMESWLACSWFRSLLADAYVKAGRYDAALRGLDDAFAVAERTGEEFFLAELYRLQGEIALAHRGLKASDDAESSFGRSFEVSRKQGARSWELRTAVTLARLWRDMGNRQGAVNLLAPIYAQFDQGFETPDLKEAAQMMRDLERVNADTRDGELN